MRSKDKIKVGLISLGCDKNRIDSEIILARVNSLFDITSDPKEAEVIIINTCGFIESAKQESIDTILEMAQHKKNGKCKLLVATGCLIQRYGNELLELIPEIDMMFGVNDYQKIALKISEKLNKDSLEDKQEMISYSDQNINEGDRILTTSGKTAYIRIAEGCNNFCTYCIIPKIRGRFRSRKMENIIKEAEELAQNGIKELILIAQDTVMYGTDLYNKKSLHILIEKLSQIEGIEIIRLLYCYPEEIYEDLIDEIAKNDKVAKYIDIPIQHISNHVLKLMGRKTTKEQIMDTIKKLRKKVPNIVIRTTFIVGFPNETEEDFKEIITFLNEFKLDKVGVFRYSQEEDTAAARMSGQIEENVKFSREKILMEVQKKISKDINASKIGKVYRVLTEGFDGEYYYGRSYEMAPDIDGNILFKSEKNIENGTFVNIKVVQNLDYDLLGVVVL
ncbi:30S ribosomal protein S12 methylthiotransferase RimO [Clostridium sp. BJN0001]|uniref:30S ribosomal protein S12 methylthiotransferase RimO n=1 Tax=Clostridium sp. BJN0001 TaxID=2930219 RepID=UPI001FD43FA9|nr:30S ribosomal protein S12 methylthiotransferase RimO [Clostridium sp. BJN0001]